MRGLFSKLSRRATCYLSNDSGEKMLSQEGKMPIRLGVRSDPQHPTQYNERMSSLHEAASLNAEGVRLLGVGNTADALPKLQSALALIKEVAVEHAENPHEFLRTLRHRNDQSLRPTIAREEHENWSFGSGILSSLKSDESYIYNRPLLIPSTTPATTLSREDVDEFILTASTFLIFNFALACHQHGMTSRSEECLSRAAALYRLTLKSLASAEGSILNPMLTILEFLALNNLANLHFDLCDYAKSQGCLNLMYDIIMTTDCLDMHLSGKEMEELMLNMIYMQPPLVAHAA
jgi:hypothetical protein